jgi:hypothetical protein
MAGRPASGPSGTGSPLAWQFIAYDQDRDTGRHGLEEAFSATDPNVMAALLYDAVLGRPPEPGSRAGDNLAQGLSPVSLAQSLLDSHEARRLDVESRSTFARDLAGRRLREELGLPLVGQVAPYVTDVDVHLVLAAYRVGLGRPPRAAELADAVQGLREGRGRETFLRMLWREPGVKARVFGPVRRDVRGAIGLVRRPRLYAGFRAHVLAVQTSVHAAILSLHRDLELEPAMSRTTTTAGDWQTTARLNEISAGIRHVLGDKAW